jgi:hypothetical protein
MVELRIGVAESPKELTLEMDDDPDGIVNMITEALKGEEPVLWVTDRKGKRAGVPVDRIAYVEVDPESTDRGVGFSIR